jgi:hypothetical protein
MTINIIKGLIMAPNECYLVALNMQVKFILYKLAYGLVIKRMLPLGCAKCTIIKELYSPIDALFSQQLVGEVIAYQGDDA